jgi:methylenetetrahydrofolate/methylenetetrahydromethanopterin dehydrogenase (NADP+)
VEKRKILLHLDTDAAPSAFDRIVALDAGADEVLSYGNVTVEQVRAIVHGAIFTRSRKELKSTAIFIGGSNVASAERLLQEARKQMLPQFGLQVSILLDANGANTTAAAAVQAAQRHLSLAGARALVIGDGPVGQRVARLLAAQGAKVQLGSLQLANATAICTALRERLPSAAFEPVATANAGELAKAASGQTLLVAAASAGMQVVPQSALRAFSALKVAIDLNAVPPSGIEGAQVGEAGVERQGIYWYGAIGVGVTKMKLHSAAIGKLFERNDHVMDAEEVFALKG